MVETLITGIMTGVTYALIAVGLSLIFGVANIVNFAQGSVYAVGGMLGWVLTGKLHWSLWPALLVVLVATAMLGLVINFVAVRPLRSAPHIAALLATYALSILMDNGSQLIFSPNVQSYPQLLATSNFKLGGVVFGWLEIVMLIVALVAMVGVAGFLRFTKYGRAVRATAQDHDAAVMMGIPSTRIESLAFMLSSALGGIAGVLIGMYNTQFSPTMGEQAVLIGFTAATLGGLGSLPGAVVGGIVLGIVEAFAISWWGGGIDQLVVFGVLVLTLWIRPSGLFSSSKSTAGSEPLTGTYLGAGRAIVMKWWQVGLLTVIGVGVLPFVIGNYWDEVGTQIIVYAILGVSLVLISGLTGQVSLGQVGPMAIGAYTVARLTTMVHWPFIPVLLLSGLTAAVISTIVMSPSWKLSGHYVSIATLGVGTVTVAAILNLPSITNGALGVMEIPAPSILGHQLVSPQALYIFFAIVLVIVMALVWLIQRSHIGTVLRAIGADQVAVRATGLHPRHYKSLAFAIGAGIAGIAGGLTAAQFTYINPTNFTTDISLIGLTVIVLGGMSSPFGAVLGAVVLIGAPELLRFTDSLREFFYGAVLLALVLFRPQGLWARRAS